MATDFTFATKPQKMVSERRDAVMMYASVVVLLILVLINLLFKIASFFRLGLPLLYALAAPILFPDWVQEQETLATIIFFGLIALVVISWVFTIRKRILRKKWETEGSL
jgi:pilus assembly protein TadC